MKFKYEVTHPFGEAAELRKIHITLEEKIPVGHQREYAEYFIGWFGLSEGAQAEQVGIGDIVITTQDIFQLDPIVTLEDSDSLTELPTESVSSIVGHCYLEEQDYWKGGLREVYRVLRPGGTAELCACDTYPEYQLPKFGKELAKVLWAASDAGFDVMLQTQGITENPDNELERVINWPYILLTKPAGGAV